jgi:hypothetical protein
MAKATALSNVTNDAAPDIVIGAPYVALIAIQGVAPFLFHRWSCEAIAEKASAAKNSKAKKSDNVDSYVYRNDDGQLSIPGEYIRQAIAHAAKFRQDPRSPRKSAFDLFKAGVVALSDLCSLGVTEWDYLDRRRVVVQRNGITRERPAMRAGWQVTCELQVLVPEYINQDLLCSVLNDAGRLVGIGDFRPTFGRFQVRGFKVG